ncbi:uncharacterized protein LOC110836528 [Zootermopsis nevadensis]|uniref:uncharacterized protein LOC110836528 n=1 Tax=Zootermopsis nevadensis TaxID=136037 RepID=UPI000B8EBA64|nr:uncharacterized protein LOC110836528 [Zootermopsis nevadensis]
MAAVWNIKDLHSPPNLTYELRLSDIDADKFTSVCLDAISILNDQEALHAEAATLSRLLYRIKSKLRCDKGFKCMKKVNHGLLCYLSMDLATVFNAIKPSPCDNGYQTMCAPSRQMLEWVLVRTQGFARLFCQVMQTCRDAAIYMKCRLRLGHMWDIALISLGIVSRIWSISKYLALCACGWYDKLKPYLDDEDELESSYGNEMEVSESNGAVLSSESANITEENERLKRLSEPDSGNEKQHRIFDLIEFGNSKDEDALESSYGNEMEVSESNGLLNLPTLQKRMSD